MQWAFSWSATQMPRKRFIHSHHLIVSERRQVYRVYRKTNKLLQILLNLFGFYRLRRVSLQSAHHTHTMCALEGKVLILISPACFWLCEWLGKVHRHTHHTYWFSHTRASVSRFTVCDSKVFISRSLTIYRISRATTMASHWEDQKTCCCFCFFLHLQIVNGIRFIST